VIKQNWILSEDEKQRIILLHENATKNLYLKEQDYKWDERLKSEIEFDQGKPIKLKKDFTFDFYFQSGFHSENSTSSEGDTIKSQVESFILNIEEVFKNFAYPRISKLEIFAGESAVPNRDNESPQKNRLPQGKLAEYRSETIKTLLEPAIEKLYSDNVIKTKPNIVVNKPVVGTSTVKDSEQATKEQYVKVNVSVEGYKSKINSPELDSDCDFQLRIVVEYKRVPLGTEKHHNCNDAIFTLLLNGIIIPREDGSETFSLNNGPRGNSVSQTLIVKGELSKQVLAVSENPKVAFACKINPICHEAPLAMSVYSLTTGKKKSGPIYLGTSKTKGEGLKEDDSREVATMDKCGNIIKIEDYYKGPSSTENPSPK
jgi:hypothetical protein